MRLQRKHMQNLMAFKFQPKVISHFQWKIVLHHHRISKDFSIAQISAIPNTKLLVSLHHSNVQGANLGIFDYSCSKSIKKIFELGDVRGGKYLSCALFLKMTTFYSYRTWWFCIQSQEKSPWCDLNWQTDVISSISSHKKRDEEYI